MSIEYTEREEELLTRVPDSKKHKWHTLDMLRRVWESTNRDGVLDWDGDIEKEVIEVLLAPHKAIFDAIKDSSVRQPLFDLFAMFVYQQSVTNMFPERLPIHPVWLA